MTAPTEANMTTLQEALPCPFCGKQHTLQLISCQELMGEDQEFWQHSESFGVVCDASQPEGKGGCGAMGGFKPTEEEAIEAWNTRTALAQQGEPVCSGCGIPAGNVHMSTCKSGKWPSRVSNGDTAAPAPQSQDWKKEPEYVPPLVKWAQEQPAQGELAEIARLHDRIKDLEADVEYLQYTKPVPQPAQGEP